MEHVRHTIGQTLGMVTFNAVYRHEGGLYVHVATGRVADALAGHYARLYLCAPVTNGPPPEASDPRVEAANIELVPQPYYTSSLGAIGHCVGIARAYARVCRRSDVLFIRGLCPYIGLLYVLAYLSSRRVCHWIVGDTVTLLRTHNRAGRVMGGLALLYALQDRLLSRVGRWLTDGAFVCGNRELLQVYHSRRTFPAISGTAIDRVIENCASRPSLTGNEIECSREGAVDCLVRVVQGALCRPRPRRRARFVWRTGGAGGDGSPAAEALSGRQDGARGRTLGWITYLPHCRQDGSLWSGGVSGRVLDRLAPHYDTVYMCAPVIHGPRPESVDLQLKAANVELIPQPYYATSLGALRHIMGIARAYRDVCQKADVLFVRGMCPYIGVLYALAAMYRRPVCHWIVGNTLALLQTHRRSGWLLDGLAMLYACQDRLLTRMGQHFAGGVFLCNGAELGQEYSSPRTVVTVSTAITEDEFFVREDTCTGDTVQILYVGYIRPEKGVEYLIEAVGRLTTRRPWTLALVGSASQFPEYRAALERRVRARGIQDRVEWAGSVPFGPALLARMRAADILVLPTLSEGTPRVLVEARANSLPLVATNVGGIPGSVTDGVDGLLVSPKDPAALALAIDLIIADGDLRRRLIRDGLRAARNLTVERFTGTVREILDELVAGSRD